MQEWPSFWRKTRHPAARLLFIIYLSRQFSHSSRPSHSSRSLFSFNLLHPLSSLTPVAPLICLIPYIALLFLLFHSSHPFACGCVTVIYQIYIQYVPITMTICNTSMQEQACISLSSSPCRLPSLLHQSDSLPFTLPLPGLPLHCRRPSLHPLLDP